jgi:hypothetical protein
MHLLALSVFADVAPFPGGKLPLIGLLFGGACGGLTLLLLIAFVFFRGGKKPAEPGPGLLEDLAAYPPPPAKKSRRLTVQGRPSRLRLIVVAPVGKRDLHEFGEIEDILNRVSRGLGDLAKEDKARLRTWPPQLSNAGFALSFFRNTQTPPDVQEAAHWSLLAGPAKAGDVPILLGVAVWSEETGAAKQLALSSLEWNAVLRVET